MIKYVILIPSFNDWECLNILIPKIDQALKNTNIKFKKKCKSSNSYFNGSRLFEKRKI